MAVRGFDTRYHSYSTFESLPSLIEAFDAFAEAARRCSAKSLDTNIDLSAVPFAESFLDESLCDFLDEELPVATASSTPGDGRYRLYSGSPLARPASSVSTAGIDFLDDRNEASNYFQSDSEYTAGHPHLDSRPCQADGHAHSTAAFVVSSESVPASNTDRASKSDSSFTDGILCPLPLCDVVNEVRSGNCDISSRKAEPVGSSPGSKVKRMGHVDAQLAPRTCRIFSCTSDLSAETSYYKRRRVCRKCVRSTSICINGQEFRFCQQCSQLHPVDEFDGFKRSCRSKLAKHRLRWQSPSTAAGRRTQRKKRQWR